MELFINNAKHKEIAKSLFDAAREVDNIRSKICLLFECSDCETFNYLFSYISDALQGISPCNGAIKNDPNEWYGDITDMESFEDFWQKYFENNESEEVNHGSK